MPVERRGRRRTDRRPVAALRPRPSGPAARFASRVGEWHPAAVFFCALLAGFVGLVAIAVLVGHLFASVLLEIGSVGDAGEGAIDSLVAARTPLLTDVSGVVSEAGGARVLSLLAGLTALVCALLRRWWIAVFALFVLPIETAAYRLTLNLVPRQRPSVERLDDLPAGGSFPSGHTAASMAGVCRARAAAHIGDPEPAAALDGLGCCGRAADRGGDLSDVSRHAPSARRRRRGARRGRRWWRSCSSPAVPLRPPRGPPTEFPAYTCTFALEHPFDTRRHRRSLTFRYLLDGREERPRSQAPWTAGCAGTRGCSRPSLERRRQPCSSLGSCSR